MSEDMQKYRFLQSVLPDPTQQQLVLLTGTRQTGKTTLVKRLYQQLRYINLDAPENRELLKIFPLLSGAETSAMLSSMRRKKNHLFLKRPSMLG